MALSLALLALVVEAIVGYPAPLLRAIGHPVIWIGSLISRTEKAWNLASLSFERRRLNGVLALSVVLSVVVSASVAIAALAGYLPMLLSALLLAAIASTCLAQRSLDEHVRAVAAALETEGLSGGQREVAKIVGRDPKALDEGGVSRAAIESLAENFSDGIVAPAFWLAVFGLPGAVAYKAINTCDSMIGHMSERYRAFGFAAAKLDDLVNLPASRLAALWIVAAAALLPKASWRDAVDAVLRDAKHHRSPNAGWPEAAMAGALGFKLAGPRAYGGVMVEDHFMGNGRAALTAADIRNALSLYRAALAVQLAVYALLALIVALVF